MMMETLRHKHMAIETTAIAVHENDKRGITVERFHGGPDHVHLTLHNGCDRGNIRSRMTKAEALQLAIELIRACE